MIWFDLLYISVGWVINIFYRFSGNSKIPLGMPTKQRFYPCQVRYWCIARNVIKALKHWIWLYGNFKKIGACCGRAYSVSGINLALDHRFNIDRIFNNSQWMNPNTSEVNQELVSCHHSSVHMLLALLVLHSGFSVVFKNMAFELAFRCLIDAEDGRLTVNTNETIMQKSKG